MRFIVRGSSRSALNTRAIGFNTVSRNLGPRFREECAEATSRRAVGRCNRLHERITVCAGGVIHLCVLRASFVVNSVFLGSSPDRRASTESYSSQTAKPSIANRSAVEGFVVCRQVTSPRGWCPSRRFPCDSNRMYEFEVPNSLFDSVPLALWFVTNLSGR